jgi:hypothetical protein
MTHKRFNDKPLNWERVQIKSQLKTNLAYDVV